MILSQHLNFISQNCHHIIFFVIISIGFIFHIGFICELYFAYKTTVSVSYEHPRKMEIPALTITGLHPHMLNKSKIAAKSPWKEQIENILSKESLDVYFQRLHDEAYKQNLRYFGNIRDLNHLSSHIKDVIPTAMKY